MKIGKKNKVNWWRRNFSFMVAVAFAVVSESTRALDTNDIAVLLRPPRVEIRDVKSIRLENQQPLTKDEEARILKLIGSLAKIKSPDFGLSPTLSGQAFAPIPEAREVGAFLMTSHQLKGSDELEELVKLGPKALPFLLNSLDNQTATKLVINHDFVMGAMWFANELRGNPGNDSEQKVLSTVTNSEPDFLKDNISSYTVKIGDVCFLAIGQIVGRPYRAVRYQPTACIVINSPTHDTNLTREVRAIWSNSDPAQHLLDSLLLDFASAGVFNGKSLDGWGVGSQLQTGAAMRLLYYFPLQTVNLISSRIHGLDVSRYDMSREVKNGVRTAEFIKAVAWSREPSIQAEMRRICEVTADPEILRAAGVALDGANADLFRKRLEESISDLPETELGPYGEGYNLLVSLGGRFGSETRPAFESYMRNASLQRRRSMCKVLAEVRGDWSVDLLGPLLEDLRPAEGWNYPVIPGQDEPRLPIRICDEAAETIAHNFPNLKFTMAGEHKDLDRQIQTMRDQIARHDY